MAIYRVQRIYSEEENGQKKSGMSTLGKVALGTAVIGGGLMAGKAGMLGTTVQRGIGKGMAWTGNKLGSTGMVREGAKTVGNSAFTEKAAELGIKDTSAKGMRDLLKTNRAQATEALNARSTATKDILNEYKITPKPTTTPAATATTTTAATQTTFSEDTNAALREAALIGTGLTLATGGVLLAKHGKLGKTAKGAYDSVSGKIEKIWKETTKKGGKEIKKEKYSVTEKTPGRSPKTSSSSTTTISTPKSPGMIFDDLDWKRIKNYCRSKGLDFRNPKDVEKAAIALGIKPIK